MKLIIARHAQTVWNSKGILQGRKDSDITAQGILQIERLVEVLKAHRFSKAYTSPSKRCIETCKKVVGSYSSLEELHEQNFGAYEGKSLLELEKIDPKLVATIRGENPSTKLCEMSESINDVKTRAAKFLAMLMNLHSSNDTVLAVSHGNFIKSLLSMSIKSNDSSISKYTHFNCAYSELELTEEGISVVQWGVASHLVGVL